MAATVLKSLLVGTALTTTHSLAHAADNEAVQETVVESADTTSTVATPTDAPQGIEEIVVTAQRRAESSQRAAIAVSVLAPEELVGVISPQQLTTLAPAVQFSAAGGIAPLLYVRGVGTFAVTPYSDPAVAVNYDGIYLARPTATVGMFYDLERVEVLKGPQGTLYGRNATGGALNILPASPRLEERSMAASVSVGNYEAVNAQAAVNLGIGDKVAVRLAGTTFRHDGYNTDGTNSERGSGARAQILFKPSPDLSIRVAGDYVDLGGTGGTGTLIARDDPRTGRTVPFGLGPDVGLYDPRSIAFLDATFVAASGNFYGAFSGPPKVDNKNYGLNTQIDANLGFADLSFVGGWRRGDINNAIASSGFFIRQRETDEQRSAELRLSGHIGQFDWLVGGYYFRDTIDSGYHVNNNYLQANQDFRQVTNSRAVFGRLTWNVSDRLRVSGAARRTWDERRFDGIQSQVLGVCQAASRVCPEIRRLPSGFTDLSAALASIGYVRPPGSPVYVDVQTGSRNSFYVPSQIPVNDTTSPSKTTFRAVVEFEPRPASLLYASVETGYRVGGFSFSTIKPEFAPETITAYTIGSKNRFLDNRLQVNLEGFIWRYKNQQVSHQTVGATGSVEFVTENIGESLNRGGEIEIVAKPLRNTTLNATLQYLDARNKTFVFDEPDPSIRAGLPAGTVPSINNCPRAVLPGTGYYRIDCSGQRPLRSPEWTVNLGIEQTIDLPGDYALVLSGNTHFQSSSVVMFERRAFSTLDAYWLSDVSASLQFPDQSFTVTGFVNNIENKRILGASSYNTFSGLTTGNYGPPRTIGIRLTADF